MSNPDFSKLHFLIVDDIAAMRQVAASQLRALGAEEIHFASNGAEALQLASRQRIDMVLSDWNMPVMDGLGLLRALKADGKLAHIPLLLVTAEVERERVREAIESGVSDLLVKPYTARRMEDKIRGAFNRAGAATSVAPPAPPVAQAAPPQKPTLLVVDDAPENLRLIAHLFEDQYRVRVADNGKKALAICTADVPPDLVLLDVMMPGMDGFEVAQKMREHPNSETIPVIFVTALTDDRSRRRGFDLGAVDFVSKPIDPDILRVRVDNFIRYVQLHKQRQAEYDAMLASSRMREDVDRMLRHDLRGPLAGVVGLLTQFAGDGGLDEAQKRRVAQIEAAATQALAAVNLSSDLFNIENGSYRLQAQTLTIHGLLLQAVESVRASFAVKQLKIELEVNGAADKATAQGDAALCHAIFHNLLKNACEAAPQGGWVNVNIQGPFSRADIDTPLRILFRNQGAVAAGMRERFFDRYATEGKSGGSGIGTYSVKLLCEAQGGSIAMETSDVEDTTTLTLALARR